VLRKAEVPPEWLHDETMRPNQDVTATLGL
jgi:hypothetical protein